MEPKKNPKADLEKLRGSFLLGGLVISLFIIFMMINLKFYDVQASELGKLVAQDEVLNGIAFDAENNRLFVTGKHWGKLFEIELVKKQ